MSTFFWRQLLLSAWAWPLTSALSGSGLASSGSALHHTAIRTKDIKRAMKFYSLLGLEEEVRFKAGFARCCWLRASSGARLELIEVPDYRNPDERAPELLENVSTLGLNHVAVDVSDTASDSLAEFIRRLNDDSERLFQKSLKMVLAPQQQQIGQDVYELAFLTDADGTLLELIKFDARIPNPMFPDW